MHISDRAGNLRPLRAGLVLLGLHAVLGAGVGAASDGGVTLYRDPDFQGAHQTFTLDVPDLGLSDDSVSSLRLAAGCRVTLYGDADFLGPAFTTTTDIADLAQTPIGDDALSSLKIDCDAPHRSDHRVPAAQRAQADRLDAPDRLERGEGVRIYEHRDFQGTSELFAGADDDLGDNPIGADSASSVQVAKGCQVTLYRDGGFQGTSVTITRDTMDLGSTPLGDEAASSLQVVCRHRPPAVYATRLYHGDGVMLFDNKHFLGRYEILAGDDPDLSDNAIGDDSASSVRLAPGCRAVLYREPDFQGASYTAVADVPDLAHTPIGNDALSSIEVTCRGDGSKD